MIKAIVVTEGEYHETLEFDTRQELYAYSRGFGDGCRVYGAGSFGVYTTGNLYDADLSHEIMSLIREHLGD